MKAMLIGLGLVALMLGSMAGRSAFPVGRTEISSKLCPKSYCTNRFDDITLMMCNGTDHHAPPGQDFVFGLFHRRDGNCLCPCDLPKYFP